MTRASDRLCLATVVSAFVHLQEAQSLTTRVELVHAAISARNEQVLDYDQRWYVMDVFEDFALIRRDLRLFKVEYTIDAEGKVGFGEPVQVEAEYRPVRVQESYALAAKLVESEAGEAEGLEWEVDIIRPGLSANGVFYPAETLREAAPLFEGARVYAFDDEPRGHKKSALEKSPSQLAGWIDGVGTRGDGTVHGTLHFLREGMSDTTRLRIVDAWKRGKKDLFGLSIDAAGMARKTEIGGRSVQLVESIRVVDSVDVVLRPAAGGRFTRLVASATATDNLPEEGKQMSKKTKRLMRVLEARRPEALAGIDRESVEFGELAAVATEAELLEAFGPGSEPITNVTIYGGEAAQTTLQEARAVESRIVLREMLAESKLPDFAQKRIRTQLAGQVLTEQQIQEAIDAERDYLATANPTAVRGLGAPREGAGIHVGAEKLDRLQAGLDRAFGLEPEDSALKNVAPLGLRALYNEITGGHDAEISGHLQESAHRFMMQEAFTNATLPTVVANTMHRRMTRDYRELDYGERRIISSVGSASDFRQQTTVRVGYFTDIPTIDPETDDYAELAPYGEEKATYAVGQRGALVTITRKHIVNDDIGHVAKVVGRLGRAARRTFARWVWAFLKANPNLTLDNKAWFHADHRNLLTVALSVNALTQSRLALFNQTEPGSTEKLGLSPHLLAVPIELEATAIAINQSQQLPGGSNNDVNPWFHKFGANNENIIVNPFLTDPTDWAVFANPLDVDILEVKFLNGQEEPELFVADAPTVGQMFVADKLQYKIRHEYGGEVIDYRGAVKSVVADA